MAATAFRRPTNFFRYFCAWCSVSIVPFKVFVSHKLKGKLEKTEKNFQFWFEKMASQLAENPFVGKPLGVPWLREKKFGKQRIYFLIYKEFESVYLADLSEKKDQQKIINSIRFLLDMYKNDLLELLKSG